MSARYPDEVIELRLKRRRLGGTVRILPARYSEAPLKAVRSNSRFSKDDPSYPAVLYLAHDFQTAFLETLVRDRFVSQMNNCEIPLKEVLDRTVVTISKSPIRLLNLIDLTGDGCAIIRAPTDAVQAANHHEGRELARALHDQHESLDGIIYESRLDSKRCYAIFERATDRLHHEPLIPLKDHADIEAVLDKYRVELTQHR